jgi:Gpi18-like mannosyltransferase
VSYEITNDQGPVRTTLLSVFLIGMICWLYYLLLPDKTGDYFNFILPWLRAITGSDGFAVFKTDFSNYTGGYISALWAMSHLEPLLGELLVIKVTAILGSLFCAVSVSYALGVMGWDMSHRWIAGLLFLLLPSVWMNGAAFAQADAYYTAFLVLSFAHILKNQAKTAIVLFCIAVSFKLQAILFAPFILGYLWHRPKYIIALILLFPLVYLGVNAIYLLSGRPMSDVLLIYLDQANTFHSLSMNAQNPWLLVRFFADGNWIALHYKTLVIAGLAVATGVAGMLILIVKNRDMKDRLPLLYWAAVILILMPFLLPKMHERFFFPAEVFLFMLALNARQFIMPALLIQAAAVLMYSSFHDTLNIQALIARPFFPLLGVIFMIFALVLMMSKRLESPGLRDQP